MTEQQKESWWKSLPGVLTTATGFIAALSGLVAGLNQLGVLERDKPAPQVVGAVAPPDTTAGRLAESLAAGASSSADTVATPSLARPGSGSTPSAPSPSAPAPITAPRPKLPLPADSVGQPARLPSGTTLALTVPVRTCAPPDGARRFTARLEAPVVLDGSPVLPAGTTAMLRVRRAGSPGVPQVRLDSLAARGGTVGVAGAKVGIARGATSGACLRANARLTVTLGAPVPLATR